MMIYFNLKMYEMNKNLFKFLQILLYIHALFYRWVKLNFFNESFFIV